MTSTELCRATGIPRTSLNWFAKVVSISPRYEVRDRLVVAVWPVTPSLVRKLSTLWKRRQKKHKRKL